VINLPYLGDFTPFVILLCLAPPVLLTALVFALGLGSPRKQPAGSSGSRPAPGNGSPAAHVITSAAEARANQLALETLADEYDWDLAAGGRRRNAYHRTRLVWGCAMARSGVICATGETNDK